MSASPPLRAEEHSRAGEGDTENASMRLLHPCETFFTWYMEATDFNGTVYTQRGLGSSSLGVVLRKV